MSAILALARPELLELEAYPVGAEAPGLARLHANESPWAPPGVDGALHRYPESQPAALVDGLAALYGVEPARLLVTRGGDEAIDLLVRCFCRAGRDAILHLPPTFGQYAAAARIQDAAVEVCRLERARGFRPDTGRLLDAVTPAVKLVFLCSPNNPTGNALAPELVERTCAELAGRAVVVLDEAYVEFAGGPSLAGWTARFPNLVVLRTLSKAHALAGARVGALIGTPELVALLARVQQPFSLSRPGAEAALAALTPARLEATAERVRALRDERAFLQAGLSACATVRRVFTSEANFLLVECADATAFASACADAGVLVRAFAPASELGDCVRVSVGARAEHERLLEAVAS
jgi:histidinol-phosphate aminotransferase